MTSRNKAVRKNLKQDRIKFYIDTSVMPLKQIEMIVNDYFYWFDASDKTEMILFTASKHPEKLDEFVAAKKRIDAPALTFIKARIKPEQLHKYYTKRFLLNEWTNYQKHDIFRLYKLFFPSNSDINFDNQAISIQYDVRYHKNRSDEYASYDGRQLASVESAICFYEPEAVFDMGCGAGAQYYFLKETLKKHHTKYYGVDISRFQTIKAIDLYASELASFTLGNAMNLNLSNNFVDIAFSESTLPFLTNPIQGLSELNRISKHGFFASVYTIKEKHDFLQPYKKEGVYALDTGATWKYLKKITPNIYYLPDYRLTKKLAKTFDNTIMIEDNSDQFFEPLGIYTSNLFFFPKAWYSNTDNKNFNFRPLM